MFNVTNAIRVNDNPPIVGECYSFIWPQELIQKVNALISLGIDRQDACARVLSQYRAENKKTPLSASLGTVIHKESEKIDESI